MSQTTENYRPYSPSINYFSLLAHQEKKSLKKCTSFFGKIDVKSGMPKSKDTNYNSNFKGKPLFGPNTFFANLKKNLMGYVQ